MNTTFGKLIILFGLCIVLLGAIIYFFHDKLHWIGRLPGDIRIERDNFRLYFPITTLIIFSLIFSFLVWLIKKNFL